MRWRVVLVGPGANEPANIWVGVSRTEAGLVFTLEHDYPDLHPQPGWGAKRRGQVYEVLSVEGRSLTVREVQ